MARLTDPEQLEQILKALNNRKSCLSWKRVAAEWLRRNLDGETQQSIEAEMLAHVMAGEEIDRQPETRPEYRDHFDFHFDFRFQVDGQKIYIETVLDTTYILPALTIVSMHYA